MATNNSINTSTNTTGKSLALIAANNVFTKSQSVAPVVLTSSSAHTATDASLSNIFTSTLTENTTIDNPTNLVDGATYQWVLKQHASSAKTVALGNLFTLVGAAWTMTTTLSGYSIITAIYTDSKLLYVGTP